MKIYAAGCKGMNIFIQAESKKIAKEVTRSFIATNSLYDTGISFYGKISEHIIWKKTSDLVLENQVERGYVRVDYIDNEPKHVHPFVAYHTREEKIDILLS